MRFSKLFFRSILCGSLSLCLLGGAMPVSAYTGSAPKEKTADTNLRVMSYNVLVDNDESLGGWSWGQALGNRGDKASACIAYYQPDVIGFQECNYKWHVSLKKNLKDYAFVNADVPEEQPLEKAESLGKKDWMCTTMMYNKKTLKLITNELIGYSCNYWGCIQRMRYVSMALFEIKATGERFVFISTHLDAEHSDEKGDQMRMTQSTELANAINHYKATYGCPVISTGDYNSGFSDPPIQNLVTNAGMTASAGNRGGIDYILYSAGIESKFFTVVGDNDVAGASDHNPVFADLQVKKYTFPTTKETTATTTVTTTTTTTETTTTTTQGSAVVITKPVSETTTTQTTTAASSGVAIEKPQEEATTQATVSTVAVDTTVAAEDSNTSWVTTTATEQIAEITDPSAETTPAEQTITTGAVAEPEEGQESATTETKANTLSPWIPIAAAGGGVLLVGGALLAAYFLIFKKKL